ncbi:MAG TPA: ATP-dependent DNA helicase RecG, partial [Xanthomonadales bacterium]|nr:ATP-dependent DNA helicase RecG [Xanthomonadales bacterium]
MRTSRSTRSSCSTDERSAAPCRARRRAAPWHACAMATTSAEAALAAGAKPLRMLRGVGPALAERLQAMGLSRQMDLWFHLPLRYEDRTRVTPVGELEPGAKAQVEGVVMAVERGFRFRPQLKVVLADDAGATLALRFFHFRGTQADAFAPGTRIRCYGEARIATRGLEMVHPSYQRVAEGAPVDRTLTPVYPVVEGVTQRRICALISDALLALPGDDALELLPIALRRRFRLSSLRDALRYVHRPPPDADVDALLEGRHPAQRRLAFEELVAHNVSLKRLRAALRREPGPRIAATGPRRAKLLAALPFELTGAQRRALAEIDRDLAAGPPMLRLVQGDVGSGKTVVAALAALAVVDAGMQAAVMAPTEVLAEQHYRNFSRWLEPLGLRVAWLAGKVKGRARANALAAVASDADLVVGTHALMQEGVSFRALALAIVDEQHRFGVHQRLALRDKGAGTTPHQLVMTATPIPRTLAMTAYADLDASVIDELPPGRKPIVTVALANAKRGDIVERIRVACAEGRQAYWVCTLIEESDLLEAQAAEAAWQALVEALPGIRVGLVHGRLKASEKQAAMDAFARGETQVLVATTVIEVGVDVPNASLMVIENAERLGLSQLHQLRGRVGRGEAASSCALLYQPPLSAAAKERLAIMRETNDGFRIAEKDLELRGPGELLGTRQTGEAGFRVADLTRDAALLAEVGAASG